MSERGPSVLFVNIPARPLEDLEAAFKGGVLFASFEHDLSMPMGLLYLASYIRKHCPVSRIGFIDYALLITDGRSFDSIREYIDWPPDWILRSAVEHPEFVPDIIAISLNFTPAQSLFDLCVERLRTHFPLAVIVTGGNHATNTCRYQLQNESLGAVVLGEGEIPLARLVNQLVIGGPLYVGGIVAKENLDRPELAESVQDLDTIPFPAWDLIDMEAYVTRASRWEIGTTPGARMACIVASRGCPFHCTFCSSHTVHGRKVRLRSIENIVAEVRELHERYGVNVIMPWDDIFTMGRARTIELLRQLRALKIPGFQVQFQNGLSVHALDEEIIDELILTGMPMTALAIESGSEDVQRNLIKKRCDLAKARHLVSYMRDKGVFVRCLFILGFAGETRAQMQETIDYAKSLQADWCVFGIASPLVGSEMAAQWVKAGVMKDGPELWAASSYGHRSFDTPEISAEDLNELAYRANLVCNFIYNPNLAEGHYERAAQLFRDIVAKFPFHVIAWYCLMHCEESLGHLDEASRICGHIVGLLKTNPLAREMARKYDALVPAEWKES